MEGVSEDLTQELQTVADDIGKDWKRLLRRLGLKDVDNVLDQVEHSYKDDLVEMAYQGLRKWRQQEGKEATLQKLLVALEKICRRDLTDKLFADRAVDTSTERTALTHRPSDPDTEQTVPKQLMSEDTPCSARSEKQKCLPRLLKTLKERLTVRRRAVIGIH
ncbi:FAS-associated death domain protein-like [Branchiostoma floridae]|uniref:FAS-associated death domain protein-like n=1 Tax=Branchiostoma floridae TaxID=7739 RepID=C3YI15_BRAFL|nr:FAS-associated death domain protein-like [Branchiostoma floridae]|eukprot:XP_002604141.1 hypothetical protein BRAFLDRAFT_71566 [Branchiostoma floridae]